MRWREGGSRQRLLILLVLVLCLYVTRLKKKECNEEKKCFFFFGRWCTCVEHTVCTSARGEERDERENLIKRTRDLVGWMHAFSLYTPLESDRRKVLAINSGAMLERWSNWETCRIVSIASSTPRFLLPFFFFFFEPKIDAICLARRFLPSFLPSCIASHERGRFHLDNEATGEVVGGEKKTSRVSSNIN